MASSLSSTETRSTRDQCPTLLEIALPSDPEAAADALLRSAGVLGRANRVYTAAVLQRRIRLEDKRLPLLPPCGLPPEVMDRLIDQRIDELVDVSRLTIRQEIVFRLRACGLSIKLISATLKIRPRRAAAALRAAQRKVRRAYHEGRYAGWYEVYLSEVNRPAYRRRR